eukprot:GGOE01018423.1.p1 GENE.GGOE01018423.1~~GGOE01018423.1.p1  ORF type:complete len:1223 (-),score=275.13 GGOE01018423.1:95-3763(-)
MSTPDDQESPVLWVRILQGRNIHILATPPHPLLVKFQSGTVTCLTAAKVVVGDADFAWPENFSLSLPRCGPHDIMTHRELRAQLFYQTEEEEITLVAQGTFVLMATPQPMLDTWIPLMDADHRPTIASIRLRLKLGTATDRLATPSTSPFRCVTPPMDGSPVLHSFPKHQARGPRVISPRARKSSAQSSQSYSATTPRSTASNVAHQSFPFGGSGSASSPEYQRSGNQVPSRPHSEDSSPPSGPPRSFPLTPTPCKPPPSDGAPATSGPPPPATIPAASPASTSAVPVTSDTTSNGGVSAMAESEANLITHADAGTSGAIAGASDGISTTLDTSPDKNLPPVSELSNTLEEPMNFQRCESLKSNSSNSSSSASPSHPGSFSQPLANNNMGDASPGFKSAKSASMGRPPHAPKPPPAPTSASFVSSHSFATTALTSPPTSPMRTAASVSSIHNASRFGFAVINPSRTRGSPRNRDQDQKSINQLLDEFKLQGPDVNYDAWDPAKEPTRRSGSPTEPTMSSTTADLDDGMPPLSPSKKVSFSSLAKSSGRRHSVDYPLERSGLSRKRHSTCLSQDFFDYGTALMDPKAAITDLRSILRTAEASEDRSAQLNANIWLGTLAFMLRQKAEAMAAYRGAFDLARGLGDSTVQVNLLAAMGDLCRTQADYPAAVESYTAALRQVEVLQVAESISAICGQIGQLYTLMGDHRRAFEFSRRQLQIAQSLDIPDGICTALAGMAMAHFGLGELKKAQHNFELAFARARSLPNPLFVLIQRHLPYWSYTYERLLLATGATAEALAVVEERHSSCFLRGLVWRTQKEVNRMRVLGSTPVQGPEDKMRLLLDHEQSLPASALITVAEDSGLTFFVYSLDRDSSALGKPTFMAWVVTPSGEIHTQVLPIDLLPHGGEPWHDSVGLSKTGFPILARRPPPKARTPITMQSSRIATAKQMGQHLQGQLAQLYDVLIQPLEKWLPPRDETLVIVPDGVLWGVPFAGLWNASSGFLIERCNVICTPSIRTFALLQLLKQIRSYLDSGFGAAVGPDEGPVETYGEQPSTRMWLQNIMRPQSSREPATRAAVKAALERCSCIHLDCSSAVDFLSDWLLHRGALVLHKGEHLLACDVAKLDLPTMLAVLPGAALQAGFVVGEGSLDIPRTMLASGTCTVVGSLWPNPLPSMQPQVMLDFYAICGNKEPDRAKAFRQAVLRTLRLDHSKPPLLWARFFIFGVP